MRLSCLLNRKRYAVESALLFDKQLLVWHISCRRKIDLLNDLSRNISLEENMDRQHCTQSMLPFFLAILLLLSLLLASCSLLGVHIGNSQPLPTLKVEPDWKMVFQTHGGTTSPQKSNNQIFSLGQFPAGSYLRFSIACIGQGSASLQTQPPYLVVATATCTDTPQTVTSDLPIGASDTSSLTVHLSFQGSIEWEVLVEERSDHLGTTSSVFSPTLRCKFANCAFLGNLELLTFSNITPSACLDFTKMEVGPGPVCKSQTGESKEDEKRKTNG